MNQLEKYILGHRADFDTAEVPDRVWENLVATGHVGTCTLEAFLAENRAALDSSVPDLRVWANIEKALPARPVEHGLSVVWTRQLMRAAAAIALIISCFGAGWWFARSGQTPDGMAMSAVSPEYAELENFYQRDIAGKQEKLASFASQREPVLDDLAQMDGAMLELQRDLANVPAGNRAQIIHAMIENYKAKAAILEKVLEHIQAPRVNAQPSNNAGHEVIQI